MGESYPPGTTPDIALARELIAHLAPGFNSSFVVGALLAERSTGAAPAGRDARELERLRALLKRGEGSRQLQHAFNNPLTALLAEVQLLEMDETLPPEHRAAAQRILALVRRLTTLTRELDADDANPRLG